MVSEPHMEFSHLQGKHELQSTLIWTVIWNRKIFGFETNPFDSYAEECVEKKLESQF